jgi:hypothetical protein
VVSGRFCFKQFSAFHQTLCRLLAHFGLFHSLW